MYPLPYIQYCGPFLEATAPGSPQARQGGADLEKAVEGPASCLLRTLATAKPHNIGVVDNTVPGSHSRQYYNTSPPKLLV